MNLYVRQDGSTQPNSVVYTPHTPIQALANYLVGDELTYQAYLDSGVRDPFLDTFFRSPLCNPSWYRDDEGRLVYRKVISKPHKE